MPPESSVGVDPRTVPHYMWSQWDTELRNKFIRLVRVNRNLIDMVWTERPQPNPDVIKVQPLDFSGEKWQSKVDVLREKLLEDRCDAMVVSSLTEIAYLLNIRGSDFPYIPVFKVNSIFSSFTLLSGDPMIL